MAGLTTEFLGVNSPGRHCCDPELQNFSAEGSGPFLFFPQGHRCSCGLLFLPLLQLVQFPGRLSFKSVHCALGSLEGLSGSPPGSTKLHHTDYAIPHHTSPCHTTPHHAIPHLTMPNHTTPCWTTPHHAIPHLWEESEQGNNCLLRGN